METLGRLREEFSESDLPFRVDLLDWAATDQALRRNIESQLAPLQGYRVLRT